MLANFKDIKNMPQSENIRNILREALDAVDPKKAVENFFLDDGLSKYFREKSIQFSDIQNIYLIGVGKAVLPMANGVIAFFGYRKVRGALITKHIDQKLVQIFPPDVSVIRGAHPVPDDSSIASARKIVHSVNDSSENDLVVCLISGGGSSLMTLPYEKISLSSIQNLTKELLESGADINEINTIRKHVDRIKGGGLLQHVWPSHSITLILSDVIGDSITMIASGPTAADPTTYKDAMNILEKYGLLFKVDESIVNHLIDGTEGNAPETVKPGEKVLEKNSNVIVGSIAHAANAALQKAKELGFNAEIVTTSLTGEARVRGKQIGERISELREQKNDTDRPICLIYGGETTVTITGDGKGGRNQELALSAAKEIDGRENCYVITLATDGEDGPTDAAGALVSGDTFKSARKVGLDAEEFLNNNDSYHFFERIGSPIKTGPTGTNVNDLTLGFVF